MICLSCKDNQEFQMVGGNWETITFDAVNGFGKITDLKNCRAYFSFLPYTNRFTQTAIRKLCKIKESIKGSGVFDQIEAELEAADTLHSYGKHTYQLTVIDPDANHRFCFQGAMIITKNIDPEIDEEV